MEIQCTPEWNKIEVFFRGIWLKNELTQNETINFYKKHFEYRKQNTGAHLAATEICKKYKIESQLENISMLVRMVGYQLSYLYQKTLQTNFFDSNLKVNEIEDERASQKELANINLFLIQLYSALEENDSDPDKLKVEQIKIKTNKSKNYISITHKENISLFVNQINNIPLTPLNIDFLDPDAFFKKRKEITRRLRTFIHENTHFKPKNSEIPFSTTNECCNLLFDFLKSSHVFPDSKIGDEVVTIRGILQDK